tara:strand:+ start:3300 stop:3515 length:216 start_codon:yes stop_codon:yes gene_type:complete
MLAFTISGQGFQPITRRRFQVIQHLGSFQHDEFPLSHSFDGGKLFGFACLKQCLDRHNASPEASQPDAASK